MSRYAVTDGAVVDWTLTREEAQRFIDNVRGDSHELAAEF